MFTRGNEGPSVAVVATSLYYSENVGIARERIMEALAILMDEPEEGLILIEDEMIDMQSGNVKILGVHSILISLEYHKGESKLICLELNDTNKVTIH
jgi:hypothetical protein